MLATITGWRLLRFFLKVVTVVLALVIGYLAVTAVQVWLTSRQYEPHPAGAILVMGAAQYNGEPSPILIGKIYGACRANDHDHVGTPYMTWVADLRARSLTLRTSPSAASSKLVALMWKM